MTLASATVDDSGDYTLTVKNPHGEKSTKATVLVKGKASASNLPVSDVVIVLQKCVVLMLQICPDNVASMFIIMFAKVYVITVMQCSGNVPQ